MTRSLLACMLLVPALAGCDAAAQTAKTTPQLAEFSRACAAGEAAGCFNAGLDHVRGIGTPKDPARAHELFTRACDLGLGYGCTQLADLERDHAARALELFEKGCALGDGNACTGATVTFATSDPAKALRLSRRGCELNDGHSCRNVVVLARRGVGPGLTADEQLRLLSLACGFGEPEACLPHPR